MDIQVLVTALADYSISKKLITERERNYSINLLLDVLNLDEYVEGTIAPKMELEEILKGILDYAYEKGLIKENSVVYRDLFDTKVMNCFLPRPSEVEAKFASLYAKQPIEATSWYYEFSKNTDYIREYRCKKDLRWKSPTEYGDIDITINLSKPEKDPKAIAAAKLLKQSAYPKCQLCATNEGYRGRLNHPARESIRLISLHLDGDDFFLQYSPYSYFNEHCIVFNAKHVPMVIDTNCFRHLLAFVDKFPHYMLGSNADLPIVGGSILTHDHYQGGAYHFPMFSAKKAFDVNFAGYEDIKASYLVWPLSVIRIQGKDPKHILSLASKILSCWREYSDEEAFVFASTQGVPHNTITPICHKIGEEIALDLVLRNNITTEEHPLGLYHPHEEYWNIKKENIGLIEVMGLAVLPSRLKEELGEVETALKEGKDVSTIDSISKHAAWIASFAPKYDFAKDDIHEIVKNEVGETFKKVLECAGVYKQNDEGYKGLKRFVAYVNKK